MTMNFQGVRAFIIEDDPVGANVLEQLLSRLNIETMIFRSGMELEKALSHIATPDLIFLDLEMPIVNGYEVLEQIQQQICFDCVPVVAYTTHLSHMNNAKRAGFHSFLGKPLDSNLFPNQIARILSGEAVWEIT